MTVVLWVLAFGAVFFGFLGIPESVLHALHIPAQDYFAEWLQPVLPPLGREETAGQFGLFALIATAGSLFGIGIAWLLYYKPQGVAPGVKRFVAGAPGLYRTVFNKYYIDEVYDLLVVRPVRWVSVILWKAFDAFVIDLIFVNGVGFVVSGFGKLSKYLQNGDLQRYVVALIIGGAALIGIATRWDAHRAARFDLSVNGRDVAVSAHGAGPAARRMQYAVDWDGDGKFSQPPQQSQSFKHTYETSGKHKIVIEAIDPRWGSTSRESRTVEVQ
jgi:NADH-quinone oxidoreductase subunit L